MMEWKQETVGSMSCSFQKETFVCGQKETRLKDGAMKEDDRF